MPEPQKAEFTQRQIRVYVLQTVSRGRNYLIGYCKLPRWHLLRELDTMFQDGVLFITTNVALMLLIGVTPCTHKHAVNLLICLLYQWNTNCVKTKGKL